VSDLDLYADLATRKLVARDGGAVTLPVLVLGDTLSCRLRTLDRVEDGDLRERDLNVRTLRASIGKVLEAPTAGGFKLRLNGADSAELRPSSTASEVQTAVQNVDDTDEFYDLQEVVAFGAGCWLLRFANSAAVPLAVAQNALQPESFARIRAFELSGTRWYEMRLIQAPLVFAGSHERVLPPPPTVRRIRSGTTEGEFKTNEIQALVLPAEFRGTYFLRWHIRSTKLLGIDDGPEEIAAALNAMFGDSSSSRPAARRFEVTNPEPDHAYIEFTGDLAGEPQPLLTVSVHSFAPGVVTFTLDLARAELASALRETAQIELPFEVELEVVDDEQDAADSAVPGRLITLFQLPVKIAREQIWEELADVPAIDWLRPPQPRDYIPFTPDQIITGAQHYVAVIGDGVQRSFSLAHNLGTEALHVTVRQNSPGGRRLRDAEFTASFSSANELVLEFPADPAAAPALNSLALTLTSAGPRSAFQAHTHTIAQIAGLQEALDLLGARLTVVEDLLPSIRPGAERDDAEPFGIEIPNKAELHPGRFPAGFEPKTLTAGARLKPGGLLPAIHDATIDPLVTPLPDAALHAGKVFQNNTGATVLIPGGLGRRSSTLPPLGFAGSDGRAWYRLARDGATNSFFPTDFERELFMLHINEQMLRAGGTFKVEFDLGLQLLVATTRAQYLLLIEAGSAPSQLTPGPTGTNLEDITWLGTPLLTQRLIVSSLNLKHHFGCAIKRDTIGALTADRLLYNVWEAAPQAPTNANFTLRARLTQFDTENSVTGAKGLVSYALTEAAAEIS